MPVTGQFAGNPVTKPTTATVLARFEDGAPAIATNVLGQGKVLVINYQPFEAGEATADAVARSALRVFGGASGKPIYRLDTPDNQQAGRDLAKPGNTWMSRLEAPSEALQPKQLKDLPTGSYALACGLYHVNEEEAEQIEAFVRSGGGLIWADPGAWVVEHEAVQRVLGFAEAARSFNGRQRTIEATSERSWLPGTEIPIERRADLIQAWERYRMQGITTLVADVSQEVKRTKPQVTVGAFVFPNRAAARGVLQDWPEWLKQGLLDYAYPMSYRGVDGLAADLAEWRIMDPQMEHIIPTLSFFDTSRNRTPLTSETMTQQIEMCEAAGLKGLCLFSWMNLRPDLEQALRATLGLR